MLRTGTKRTFTIRGGHHTPNFTTGKPSACICLRIVTGDGDELTLPQGTVAGPEHPVLHLPNDAISCHREGVPAYRCSPGKSVLDHTIERRALSRLAASGPGIWARLPPGVHLCCAAEPGDGWDVAGTEEAGGG